MHYTKFPQEKVLKNVSAKFQNNFTILRLQSGQSNRVTIGDFFRRDKKQESLITYDLDRIFAWNFSKFYEKVHNPSAFARIFHEKVVHLKSDVHYCRVNLLKSAKGLFEIVCIWGNSWGFAFAPWFYTAYCITETWGPLLPFLFMKIVIDRIFLTKWKSLLLLQCYFKT